MFKNRVDNVINNMKKAGLSQIIVSDPNSLFYLTGTWFYPGERMIALMINDNARTILFINKLFSYEDKDVDIVYYKDGQDGPSFINDKITGNTLGIDKCWPSKFLIRLLDLNKNIKFVNSSFVVDDARAIKDEDEKELMITSSLLNDKCINEFKSLLHYGVSEKEVMDGIYKIYKKNGCENVSFTPIVAFKNMAADPHHETDDVTILEPGDRVLLDVGGRYKDYCSDMTRVFFTKEPSEFELKIYNLVRKANEEATKAIKPGVCLKDIDGIARKIITDAGYGPYFNHRLGHFIGIEDHDAGDVSEVSEIIAKPGMIFSIEPGIYIKDKIGIRIEDLVMVTEDGVKVLNHYPHEIEILNLK